MPRIDEFVEFLRRNIGDLDNVTNGNRYRLSGQDFLILRPTGVPLPVLESVLQATLDLKIGYDSGADYYEFWYDPL